MTGRRPPGPGRISARGFGLPNGPPTGPPKGLPAGSPTGPPSRAGTSGRTGDSRPPKIPAPPPSRAGASGQTGGIAPAARPALSARRVAAGPRQRVGKLGPRPPPAAYRARTAAPSNGHGARGQAVARDGGHRALWAFPALVAAVLALIWVDTRVLRADCLPPAGGDSEAVATKPHEPALPQPAAPALNPDPAGAGKEAEGE